jgi:hypothetical protein
MGLGNTLAGASHFKMLSSRAERSEETIRHIIHSQATYEDFKFQFLNNPEVIPREPDCASLKPDPGSPSRCRDLNLPRVSEKPAPRFFS